MPQFFSDPGVEPGIGPFLTFIAKKKPKPITHVVPVHLGDGIMGLSWNDTTNMFIPFAFFREPQWFPNGPHVLIVAEDEKEPKEFLNFVKERVKEFENINNCEDKIIIAVYKQLPDLRLPIIGRD